MTWRIPLTTPELGREEIEAVTRVLESKWLTMGPVTTEFECQFAKKMAVKHALAVSSCTAALHMAYVALGLGPEDEVICPALTFVATASAARYTGARIAFADVWSQTDWTISADDIRKKITSRTKAIAVVHYAGFPCRMDDIRQVARDYDLKIIEDCAHAPFARYKHNDSQQSCVGTLGDIGCFSFFSNKNMTTGEGGMVTTNDDYLAERMRLLRSHGMTALTYDRHKGHANGYDVVTVGYNYRLDEIRSAIGLCQLDKIDGLTALRRTASQCYRDALSKKNNITVPFMDRDLCDAACHIFPILSTSDAAGIRRRLTEAGIQISRHYDLIPSFSAYSNSAQFRSTIPAADIITLPLGPSITREQIEEIVSII